MKKSKSNIDPIKKEPFKMKYPSLEVGYHLPIGKAPLSPCMRSSLEATIIRPRKIRTAEEKEHDKIEEDAEEEEKEVEDYD